MPAAARDQRRSARRQRRAPATTLQQEHAKQRQPVCESGLGRLIEDAGVPEILRREHSDRAALRRIPETRQERQHTPLPAVSWATAITAFTDIAPRATCATGTIRSAAGTDKVQYHVTITSASGSRK